MRLFKVLIVTVALLDAALFLQSPSSPLSATTPVQVVGYSTAEMATAEPAAVLATTSRP